MAQQLLDNYSHLPDESAFPPIIELSSVDSTNNYALACLKRDKLTERQETVVHGFAVFAHEQYAGKGQRGKTWLSDTGQNIHLSIIINPKELSLLAPFNLIAIVALSVRAFFEQQSKSDIFIKWPNDIYFQDRKAGGILIENVITGNEWKWAVAGIGLNINQTEFDHTLQKKAVSLKQITGKSFTCFELAKELRNAILIAYREFTANPEKIIASYNRFLYKKNKQVKLEKDGNVFEATLKEVLSTGQLVVQTETELKFDFGEVKWII